MRYVRIVFVAWTCVASGWSAENELVGAGATFPAPLYRKWTESFQTSRPGLAIRYDAVGSGEGLRRLRAGECDFAASDIPLSNTERSQFSFEVIATPSVIGAVVPVYNLPKVFQAVRFTPGALAGIYLGRITKWNDPEMKRTNKGVALPDSAIVVVHRTQRSGTTFIWTNYLSGVSENWKVAAGAGSEVKWPTGMGAASNSDMTETIQKTPYSIGYVEWIYAVQNHLSYGSVENAAGKFVQPDIESIRIAAKSADDARGFPLVAQTFFIAPRHAVNAEKRTRLTEFLLWVLDQGQKQAAALGFIALPDEALEQARRTVATIE